MAIINDLAGIGKAVAETASSAASAVVEQGPVFFWAAVDATPFIFDRSKTRIKETFSPEAKAKALEELGARGQIQHVENQDLACLSAMGDYEKARIKDLEGFEKFVNKEGKPLTLPNGMSLTKYFNSIKSEDTKADYKSDLAGWIEDCLAPKPPDQPGNTLKTCQEDLEHLNELIRGNIPRKVFSPADYACALTDIKTRAITALDERHNAEQQGIHWLLNPDTRATAEGFDARQKKAVEDSLYAHFSLGSAGELAQVEASFIAALKESQAKEKAALDEAFNQQTKKLFEEQKEHSAKLDYIAAMAKTNTAMGSKIQTALAGGHKLQDLSLKDLAGPTNILQTADGLKITYNPTYDPATKEIIGHNFSLHLSKFSSKGDQLALRSLAEAKCSVLGPEEKINFSVSYTQDPLRAQELARLYIEELAALGIDPQEKPDKDGKTSCRLNITVNNAQIKPQELFTGPHAARWSALVNQFKNAETEQKNQQANQQGRGNAQNIQSLKNEMENIRKSIDDSERKAQAAVADATTAVKAAQAAVQNIQDLIDADGDPADFANACEDERQRANDAVTKAKAELEKAKVAAEAVAKAPNSTVKTQKATEAETAAQSAKTAETEAVTAKNKAEEKWDDRGIARGLFV